MGSFYVHHFSVDVFVQYLWCVGTFVSVLVLVFTDIDSVLQYVHLNHHSFYSIYYIFTSLDDCSSAIFFIQSHVSELNLKHKVLRTEIT